MPITRLMSHLLLFYVFYVLLRIKLVFIKYKNVFFCSIPRSVLTNTAKIIEIEVVNACGIVNAMTCIAQRKPNYLLLIQQTRSIGWMQKKINRRHAAERQTGCVSFSLLACLSRRSRGQTAGRITSTVVTFDPLRWASPVAPSSIRFIVRRRRDRGAETARENGCVSAAAYSRTFN